MRAYDFWTKTGTVDSGPYPIASLSLRPRGAATANELQLLFPSAMPVEEQLAVADRVLAGVQRWRDGLAEAATRQRTAEDELAAGIAIALDSAQLLLTSETAAELKRLQERVTELEAAPATVYRAEHDCIVMGYYRTREAAREHCEAEERRSWLTGSSITFAWVPDDSDPLSAEELSVFAGQNEESVTGYIVTPLEVPAAYDPDADE